MNSKHLDLKYCQDMTGIRNDPKQNLLEASILQIRVIRTLRCSHRKDDESNTEVELMIAILEKSIELTTEAERLIKGDVK